MFFESSPDLWFKVVDATFNETKIFSESSHFTLTVLKLNSNQLEIVGNLLHGSHPHPYFQMKRLANTNLWNHRSTEVCLFN